MDAIYSHCHPLKSYLFFLPLYEFYLIINFDYLYYLKGILVWYAIKLKVIIEKIKSEATEKIKKLQNDRNIIVGQIIKDQGGIEKLEKLINADNKVESN